jgi:hypothetical protein
MSNLIFRFYEISESDYFASFQAATVIKYSARCRYVFPHSALLVDAKRPSVPANLQLEGKLYSPNETLVVH